MKLLKMSLDKQTETKDNNKQTTLAFHKIQSSFTFGSTNYSPKRFEILLQNLQKQGRGFDDTSNTNNIQITFDDGYKHISDPLLVLIDKYKIKPIIFIPTYFIGKSNAWDYSYLLKKDSHLDKYEIKTLSQAGVKFGTHGHSHTAFIKLSNNKLKEELNKSKQILEDIIGSKVDSISYPFGRYNRNILETTAEAGYKFGYTMNFPTSDDSPLTIGRYPIYCYDTIFTVNQKINHGKLYFIEQAKAKFTNKLSGGTIALNQIRKKRI